MSVAVYIVRPGPNPELRFSLRSVEANLPEITDVVIVGHAEQWLRKVRVVDGNPHGRNKRRNVWANIYTAATSPGLPGEIVLMNDDFMVMEPARVAMAYRGTLADHIESVPPGWWRTSLEVTERWLAGTGHESPLSYELHRPFPINRERMAKVIEEAAEVSPNNPPQWRSIYGNRWQVGGYQDRDGKVYDAGAPTPSGPWLSTTEGQSFESVLPMLAERFPNPSRWEREVGPTWPRGPRG